MINLSSPAFLDLKQSQQFATQVKENDAVDFAKYQQWNHEGGWKNTLNNLRLILQPLLIFWLVYPWLNIFHSSDLLRGFSQLISAINQFKPFYSSC
jgi:hypothetical protein